LDEVEKWKFASEEEQWLDEYEKVSKHSYTTLGHMLGFICIHGLENLTGFILFLILLN